MRSTSLALILLCAAPLSAKPWYLRAADNLGHNAKLSAVDCVRDMRMRFECGVAIGAMLYDFKTTRDFEDCCYPHIREANPLFGAQAKSWRMALIGGALLFAEIDGLDYVRRNEPKGTWWEMIDLGAVSGLHVYAGIHNEHLISACQRSGVCSTTVPESTNPIGGTP